MKKKLLLPISTLLIMITSFYSCQKESGNIPGIDSAVASNSNKPENQCRLVSYDWPSASKMRFHYNDKGLADQWIIDLDFAIITIDMVYDNNNRLISATEDIFGETYAYQFFYTGQKLTRELFTNVNNPADFLDFTYTYNSKGLNIRQDDAVNDQHVVMDYDDMGNCVKTSIYFGSDLYYTDEYTFNIPAKNPLAAVPGITTGFPSYGPAQFADKWIFSSNKTAVYDNGIPILLNDYDPTQTTINTGNHNYPFTADYFDPVNQYDIHLTCEYENCNGNSGSTRMGNQEKHDNLSANKTMKKPILNLQTLRLSRSLKKDIDALRKQHK